MISKPWRRVWSLWGVAVLLNIATLWLFWLNRSTELPAGWGTEAGRRDGLLPFFQQVQFTLIGGVLPALLGIVIVMRRSRHPIGWLLFSAGSLFSLIYLLQEVTIYTNFTVAEPLPGARVIAWIANWWWVLATSQILLIAAIFPDGRLASPSHRWVLWAIGLFTVVTVGLIMAEQPLESAFSIPNPFLSSTAGIPSATTGMLAAWSMALAAISVAIVDVLRFLRARGAERQQLKWLAGAVISAVAWGIGSGFISSFVDQRLGQALINWSFLILLSGIGAAVLRYRLYDIDVIFNRALVYTAVTAVLALVYYGSVVALQGLFSGISERSPLTIVLSTLAIAALFNPLRQRIQHIVDQRFYRRKYNAQQTLARFAHVARDEVDIDNLQRELQDVVVRTMQPEHIQVWLREARK